MRILVLSSWWPEPANNGARLRISNLLRALAQHHEVHLISFAQEPVTEAQLLKMREICASVQAIPQRVWQPRRGEQIISLWQAEPSSFRATWNPEFDACVRARVAALQPDVVIAFAISTARYAAAISGIPRILEELEVGNIHTDFLLQRAPHRRLRAWLTWRKHVSYVQRLLRQFDACTVVSANEQQLVRHIAPEMKAVHVLPNGTDVSQAHEQWGEPQPGTLIYPGALTYDANFDAVRYFLQEIFPHIQARHPEVRFSVTGAAPTEKLAALPHSKHVEFTGYVPDVRPLIARSWCEVVPLRQGGGTRLKVLEAMALGAPVVSTPKGVEGLDLVHGTHALIAQSAGEFATEVIRLLERPELRTRLAANGRRHVVEHYDWRTIGQHLNELVADIAAKRLAPGLSTADVR